MQITVTVDHETILKLIREHVASQLGEAEVKHVDVLVKSIQNYRLKEWEKAHIVATNDDTKYPQVKAVVECA